MQICAILICAGAEDRVSDSLEHEVNPDSSNSPLLAAIYSRQFSAPGKLISKFHANPENFSHAQNPIMNTTDESFQTNPVHPRTSALLIALKKIAAVTLALTGIGFILWLDS